jgi:aromatic-L-amino-acid decarboxylase
MINNEEFRKNAHQLVDWMADYMAEVEKYPVKSSSKPGEILAQLPEKAPNKGEAFNTVWKDFQNIIMPGITHWQSPNFYAYFPANGSYPSLLAEMLTATLGAQCMIWETSPAAAELEERVLNWLRDEMAIPQSWHGVIQDTASTATLAAILTAREQHSKSKINIEGFTGSERYRIYCSTQTHSSIEKAVSIAGIGAKNLVKIAVDSQMAMISNELEKAIEADINNGYQPLCVVSALGSTSTVAIDPINAICNICEKYKIWHHIDAAYAGTALLLPEYHFWVNGIEKADSFVFNPHKWMFTNFDCTAYYVKDKEALITTFEILPEYLKTKTRGQVNDYRDWGIPLGRRFRALKLWFVIRDFGLNGIREKLRFHISLREKLELNVRNHKDFEVVLPSVINMLVFRFKPSSVIDESLLNDLNEQLIAKLNNSGKMFLTHTKVGAVYVIRMPIGQTYVEQRHIDTAWELIQHSASSLQK